MLTRFVHIRDELLKASLDDYGSIPIDTRAQFLNKIKKSSVMLSETNEVTKIIQTGYRTLSACRGDIDLLLEPIKRASSGSHERLFVTAVCVTTIFADSLISTNLL